jgi:hypothetical protein
MSRAAAVLNVSEIEKLIGMDGTRNATSPAPTVREIKTTKAGDTGWVTMCHPEYKTTSSPVAMTVATNGVARWVPVFCSVLSTGASLCTALNGVP